MRKFVQIERKKIPKIIKASEWDEKNAFRVCSRLISRYFSTLFL